MKCLRRPLCISHRRGRLRSALLIALAPALLAAIGCAPPKLTTASARPMNISVSCVVRSNGSATTLQLSVFPELEEGHALLLDAGDGTATLKPFRHETSDQDPDGSNRNYYAASLPPVRSFSLAFQGPGEPQWAEVKVPQPPVLSVSSDDTRVIHWQGLPGDGFITFYVACAGETDRTKVAMFSSADNGTLLLSKLLEEARLRLRLQTMCEKLRVVAVRAASVPLYSFKVGSAACNVQQMQTLTIEDVGEPHEKQ